jgi:hypothetical protein
MPPPPAAVVAVFHLLELVPLHAPKTSAVAARATKPTDVILRTRRSSYLTDTSILAGPSAFA